MLKQLFPILSWLPKYSKKDLFDDLPVLIVDTWGDISENLLRSTIEDFKDKKFNVEKLNLSYWVKQFD